MQLNFTKVWILKSGLNYIGEVNGIMLNGIRVIIIKTNIYKDKRGFFKEVEQNKILKKKFIFDCFSYLKKNTLRGIQLQI